MAACFVLFRHLRHLFGPFLPSAIGALPPYHPFSPPTRLRWWWLRGLGLSVRSSHGCGAAKYHPLNCPKNDFSHSSDSSMFYVLLQLAHMTNCISRILRKDSQSSVAVAKEVHSISESTVRGFCTTPTGYLRCRAFQKGSEVLCSQGALLLLGLNIFRAPSHFLRVCKRCHNPFLFCFGGLLLAVWLLPRYPLTATVFCLTGTAATPAPNRNSLYARPCSLS